MRETIELLRRLPLFSTLSEDELSQVAEVATIARFAADDVVFREDELSSTCYVIRSDHAAAVRDHPAGRSIPLARFGPGDIFGELAMLDDQRRSATVQTVQGRVARVLVQLVQAARAEGAEDGDVLIISTPAELARMAGSSRESTSRFLAALERAGIITQGRGRLTVRDPAALERYVY